MASRSFGLLGILLFCILNFQGTKASVKKQSMTQLLDKLLEGYDKRLRPDFGQGPLIIKADILIRSMGPVSERDMIYSMDCYFRQLWTDERLAFNVSLANVSLNIKMLERIWSPDTIVYNGQESFLHEITMPNKFFRINKDGTILYSQRLTIKARCLMQLQKFPMDMQQCPLHLISFGYTENEVLYKWRFGAERAVDVNAGMTLSQFDLTDMPAWNGTTVFREALHSMLSVNFHLKRHMGFFLLQVYVPCTLLVVVSWVSFWIHREATSDRIALGTTTVLSMTFLGLDNRTYLPKVSYSTALDVYVAMCYVFVLATLIQFAAVHYFTKYDSGEENIQQDPTDTEESEEEKMVISEVLIQRTHLKKKKKSKPSFCSWNWYLKMFWYCLSGTRNFHIKTFGNKYHALNSVSQIDIVSRRLFPLVFLILSVSYWVCYLY
ncbi:gamma-aminobutyric acid receptor alpha-like [Octopus vulgaris]|uniref:Gamma-aminobutyric acid receptor alpha-like n=1 Tax=Octopus vulgaris TaxID=6645 RepID=A0AA36C1V9_OCTVU|nr:gamma-aminobutyric acid receptor alpha-like [Octopus vulgaris]